MKKVLKYILSLVQPTIVMIALIILGAPTWTAFALALLIDATRSVKMNITVNYKDKP